MAPRDNDEAASRERECTSTESPSAATPLEYELGAFCAEAIEALVREGSGSADETVAEAVRVYLRTVGEKPELAVSPVVPPFEEVEAATVITLDLTEAERGRLEAEAARQGVSAQRLVEQATIVAYAELDRRRS
jgi:hypothetical protein